MKFHGLLIGLFFMHTLCQAQNDIPDSLLRHYYKYPQTALQAAGEMYRSAQSEHNTPLLIKSLILKTTFSLQVNRNDYPKMLKELETYTAQEKNIPAQCILHSYLGELYLQYYANNNYRINQRTPLQGEVPEDLNEWSGNLFLDKILSHFSASVQPGEILQRTPVKDYQTILIPGNASDSLRPTLYDFLCHRAIKQLDQGRFYFQPISNLEDAEALGDLQTFLQMPVSVQSLDAQSHILKYWQELLRFRLQEGQENALLLADLERLDNCHRYANWADRDSLYLQTLATMREKFSDTPMSVEIIAKEAALIQNLQTLPADYLRLHQPESVAVCKTNKEKAQALCQMGIKRFPRYSRINLLHNLLNSIQAPSLQTTIPNQLYPGEKLPVKISSCNLPQVQIQLNRILTSTEKFREAKNGKVPRTTVHTSVHRLQNHLNIHDTTFFIPVPKSGLYQIVLKTPKTQDSITSNFICSQLFCASQARNRQRNFQVNDWKSGQPVKNAKIFIYKERYPKLILSDSVFTNEKGFATYTVAPNKAFSFQVVNPANPNGTIQQAYGYYPNEEQRAQITFITDRSLYQPGQIVYFQGITWMATTDTLYPFTRKKINVQLKDPNGKTIAEQKAVSDSFGSFAGNFVLPEQLLNGTYRLTSDHGGNSRIHVEEYKRPEFEVTLQTPRQTYYLSDSIHVTGLVKSFSGIAHAGQEVQYEISVSSWERYAPQENILQGITTTDPEGQFLIHFKAQADKANHARPLFYKIKVKTTDSKGETQENELQIAVYTGTATPQLSVPRQINKANSTPFVIELDHLPPHMQPQTVQYSIYQLQAPKTLLVNLDMQDTIVVRTVLQGEIRMTQRDTLYPILSKEPSGAYLFCVKHGDTESKQIFYLYSAKDRRPPVPTYSWLIEEKTVCLPGDTARIRFGTSAPNAYVLYEINNADRLLRKRYIRLSDSIINIDIPYLATYGKRIWLTVYYVKDKKNFQETIQIAQQERNRTLTFQTSTFRDHLVPGQQEEWSIRILNEQGEATPTQALAFMYDASLDKLSPHTLDFHPAYLYPNFRYNWNIPYDYQGWQWRRMPYRLAGGLKYPGFKFYELNTFGSNFTDRETCTFAVNKLEAVELEDFGDSDGFVHVTGTKMSSKALARGAAADLAAPTTNAEAGSSPVSEITYRTDFQETAFFYPQLQTDSAGDLHIRFKVPQSLTNWKFNLLAYTQQLAHGTLTRTITTSKPLMVRPNLPRFFRSGDLSILKVTVSNLTDSLQQGTAGVELFLPGNQQILLKQTADFRIKPNDSQTLDFTLQIPENIDLAGCRIFAGNRTFSDGEQHLLPVLPNEILLTETLPIFSTQTGTHTYTLERSSSSRKNYRLTLELAANPIWYAVLALPSLSEPQQENTTAISASFYVNTIANKIIRSNPQIAAAIRQWKNTPGTPTLLSQLARNAELKSVLLEASPWVLDAENETEQMQKLSELFDENRLHYLQEQALKQLKQLQNADGGWSWFKGMYSNPFITTNLLTILSRAATVGDFQADGSVKQMQIKGLHYLDNQIKSDFKNKNSKINYNQLLYLYVRSFYRDIPLGDALEAHKHYLALVRKQWSDFSLYEKAISAVTLNNYGFQDEARNILESLRQYAVNTPEDGMYWPNNRNVYYRNSAVQIHTAIMEAFTLVEGNTKEVNLMKQWLLRQKQVQNWGSVPSTVDAIYALLLTGNDLLSEKEQLTVRLGNQQLSTSQTSEPLGYLKKSYSSSEIHPDMLTVKMTKETDAPSWGGLYLQYFEKLNQVKKQKTEISVDKKLYVEKNNAKGVAELLPLDKQPLKVGDKVIVRLTFTLNRDMEFLHLKELRAGCFEPVEQLSGNHWKFGTVYYQEIKNAATNFFFTALSRGTYVLEYPVWVNQAGSYQDGIATFQSIYAPEYSAHSGSRQILVNP